MNNTTWIIKDGKNTRFWRDKWISNVGTLEDLFPSTCPAAELNFPVSFYASAFGLELESFGEPCAPRHM